jgi:hypothetical protein
MVMAVKVKRMKQRYEQFINGQPVENLEQVIVAIQQGLNQNTVAIVRAESDIAQLENKVSVRKGKLAINRYKAFADRGSDMSFSMAITDDAGDGVVLTGIYHTDYSYMYAKPLKNGHSEYKLSPEELKVIEQAKEQ